MRAGFIQLRKGAWVAPVSKARCVVVTTAAAGDDEGEEDKTDYNNDLERGQPEFKLAEEFDASKVVDADD